MRANIYGLTTNVVLNKALKIRKTVPIREINVVTVNHTRNQSKSFKQEFSKKFFVEAAIIPNLPRITLALRKGNAKFSKNK